MLATRRVGAAPSRTGSQRCSSSASTACLASRVALTSWDSSRHANQLHSAQASSNVTVGPGRKAVTMMGNKASGGIFSPLVVVVRNAMGEKDFNKFRGKAISVHSQIIKDFCKQIGVENKQVQGVIRLAKKNGEWLGFLA